MCPMEGPLHSPAGPASLATMAPNIPAPKQGPCTSQHVYLRWCLAGFGSRDRTESGPPLLPVPQRFQQHPSPWQQREAGGHGPLGQKRAHLGHQGLANVCKWN